MDRLDFFFRQTVTEAELDEALDKVEAAINQTINDQGFIGVFSGGQVTQRAGTPNLSVDVGGPMVGYDQLGRRVSFSPTQNVDVSLDENGVSTAVAAGGNEKTLSVFAEFDRLLSDARLDGNNDTIFFLRDESFVLNVAQSAEAPIGTSVPPPLRADQFLLADIVIVNAQTQVLNGDIDTARRQIAARPADAIGYAGGPNWADGTTNPATNVEAQLDKILGELADTTVSDDGAAKVGGELVQSGGETVLSGTTVRAQLTELANGNHTDRTFAVAAGSAQADLSDAVTWEFNDVDEEWTFSGTPANNLYVFVEGLPEGERVVGAVATVNHVASVGDNMTLNLIHRNTVTPPATDFTDDLIDTQDTAENDGTFQDIVFSFSPFDVGPDGHLILEIDPDATLNSGAFKVLKITTRKITP